MVEELREYTTTLLLPPDDPYHPWEKRFLDDTGTHHRYMRAAKWKLDDAKKRIKATMEWRREFQPDLIKPDEVAETAATGKLLLNGFDKESRPIIYMRPGRGRPPDNDKQIRYLIFLLERAIDIMPDGQERVCIIVDYKDANKQPRQPMNVSLYVLNVLQNHYVERLGRGLILNMPWFVNGFFKAISPFMDPVTRDKARFNPILTDLVDPAQLEADYKGGEHAFELDIDTYLQHLKDHCCICEDGTRHFDGVPWYPPSGRGIVHAKETRKAAASEGEGEGEGEGETASVDTVAAQLEKTQLEKAEVPAPAPTAA
ncbi:CRAL/TRIO domain-containing protein [Cutaneotrichosporon oleaginosum]|uniref:CRAL/TRIO domain-containing protein n=2 Tax=Cutaneotrichosporon oleaginosum TaxID=879819 RepID=A0A0J0XHE6_9TREE|nr:CRAL/TRIO domain-containing protein [Cutaneotrichosporon oleaginosum]KLT40427.1 CRAL/TRIO domain-containing protein [Cutaneotrichosporon oleaginosum]